MAIVTVYNRDGTEYGTLDTNQYVFNNTLISFKPVKLDSNIYPYVKINGVYYVNDGEEFFSRGRTDNSAGLMNINNSYKWDNNKSVFNKLDSYIPVTFIDGIDKDNLTSYDQNKTEVVDNNNVNINTSLLYEMGNFKNIPRYYVGNKTPQIWSFYSNVQDYSNNSTYNGQCIFDDFVTFGPGATSKDVKYWGGVPSIYPIVLCNTMEVKYPVKETSVTVIPKSEDTAKVIVHITKFSDEETVKYDLSKYDSLMKYERWQTGGTSENTQSERFYLYSNKTEYNDPAVRVSLTNFDTSLNDMITFKDRDTRNNDDVPYGFIVWGSDRSPKSVGAYLCPLGIGTKYSVTQDDNYSTGTSIVDLSLTKERTGLGLDMEDPWNKGWKTGKIVKTMFFSSSSSQSELSHKTTMTGLIWRYHTIVGLGKGNSYDFDLDPAPTEGWDGVLSIDYNLTIPYFGVESPYSGNEEYDNKSLSLKVWRNNTSATDTIHITPSQLEDELFWCLPNGISTCKATVSVHASGVGGGWDGNWDNISFDFSIPSASSKGVSFETEGSSYVVWKNASMKKDFMTPFFYVSRKGYGDQGITKIQINRYDSNYNLIETIKHDTNDGHYCNLNAFDILEIQGDYYRFFGGSKTYICGEYPPAYLFIGSIDSDWDELSKDPDSTSDESTTTGGGGGNPNDPLTPTDKPQIDQIP